MKKIIVYVLSIICVAAIFTACTATQPQENSSEISNPVTEYDTAEELSAKTGLTLSIPSDISDVSYSSITSEDESPIAQCDFTYNGKNCTYRTQLAKEAADISGVYEDFDKSTEMELSSPENITQSTIQFTNCSLKFTDGGYGVAVWYDNINLTTCSLSMDNCTENDLSTLAQSIISVNTQQ